MATKEQMRSAIAAAIKELNDRGGSTATEIRKHVKANMPDGEQWQEATFNLALKELDENGDIVKSGTRYTLPAGPEATFSVKVCSTQPRQQKMADLWRNGKLCDAEVVSSDGRSFHAHRLVLATNSDYMSALLAEDRFKDSSDCPIQLPDISSQALVYLLEWMYTGRCKVKSLTEVAELLEAASRLQCQDLIEQLESATLAIIDNNSCLNIWELGKRFSLDKMGNEAKLFAIKNFDKVASSEDFKELSLERLLELVGSDNLNVEKEEDVHTSVMMWVEAQAGDLSPEDIEKLFASVRYPLMDKVFVLDHVLNEPRFNDISVYFRTVARSICDPDCSKRRGGRPLAWEDVKKGVEIRVIDDVEELKRLCYKIAPEAERRVGWGGSYMEEVAGTFFKIGQISANDRSVETKTRIAGDVVRGRKYWVPFTALRFA